MTITPTQLNFFLYELNRDCVKNVKDHTKSEIEKSNAKVRSQMRKTEDLIKFRNQNPPLTDKNIIVKIIQFLSYGTLAIICRVGRVWNIAVCESPMWLRIFRINYPDRTYISSSSDPRLAKVFFSRLKATERLDRQLDTASEKQEKSIEMLRDSSAVCAIALTPVWLLILAEIASLIPPDPSDIHNYRI